MIGVFDITNNYKKLELQMDTVFLEVEDVEFPDLNGLIIDWVDKSKGHAFTKQALLIDYYTRKKIPIVIYDRNMKVTRKEYKWLNKFRTFFFEPALNHRLGFRYLPHWVEMLSMNNFNLEKKIERSIDLAYPKNLRGRMKCFEKYYVEYAKMQPDTIIIYCGDNLPHWKVETYKEHGLKNLPTVDWSHTRFTLAIDSKRNYNIGYLDPYIFTAMKHGCVPFIPSEHKYFNGIFKGLEIGKYHEMSWFINSKTDMKEAMIEGVYKDIEKYYPEFTIEYASNMISECFK